MFDLLSTIFSVAALAIAIFLAGIAWVRCTSAPARGFYGDQIDEDRP